MSATRPVSALLTRTRRAVPPGHQWVVRAKLLQPAETDASGRDAEPAAGAAR